MKAHTPRLIFAPHPSLGWKLSPNSQVSVAFRNATQTTDESGWRTVVNQPSSASLNVGFYGCSFTYGTGLADGETFTSLLQGHFKDVKILSRGIGGHGSVQNYIQFRQDVAGGKVDAAFFCIISDHRFRNIGHPVRMKSHLSPDWYKLGVEHVPRAKLNRSGEVEIEYLPIWQPALLKNDFSCFLPPDYYLDQVTFKVLSTIDQFGTEHNIPCQFLLLDSIDSEFNKILKDQFPKVEDISTPYNKDFTFLPDDIHPNVRANAKFYERMVPMVEALANR